MCTDDMQPQKRCPRIEFFISAYLYMLIEEYPIQTTEKPKKINLRVW